MSTCIILSLTVSITLNSLYNMKKSLLPTQWFDDRKEIHINLPLCNANYKQSRKFQRSLQSFTRGQYKFRVQWKTKKVKSLFKNKDRNNHPSRDIYHGTCSCQANYVEETSRNLQERISEHEDTTNSPNLLHISVQTQITRSLGKSSLSLVPFVASSKPY